MVEFVLFLTRNDVTVPDAFEIFDEIRNTKVKYVGFKDIGLPLDRLHDLRERIAEAGKIAVLEVVSTSKEANMQSVRMGIELKVDYLIGGTFVDESLPLVRGTGVRYFPYIGTIVGHPCLQRGTIREICDDARRVEQLGVDGIDLLSYRYDGDPVALTGAVTSSVNIPVLVAGSVNSFERIRSVGEQGAWGFTIGTAILDKAFLKSGSIADQINSVLETVGSLGRPD